MSGRNCGKTEALRRNVAEWKAANPDGTVIEMRRGERHEYPIGDDRNTITHTVISVTPTVVTLRSRLPHRPR